MLRLAGGAFPESVNSFTFKFFQCCFMHSDVVLRLSSRRTPNGVNGDCANTQMHCFTNSKYTAYLSYFVPRVLFDINVRSPA